MTQKTATTPSSLPRLYNPAVTIILSFLFTPIMGALLQSWNWKELGNKELEEKNLSWVRWSFAVFALYTLTEPFTREIEACRYLMIILFVVMWSLWSFTLGFKQYLYVRDTLNGLYEGKFFGRVIMVGAFGWVGYCAVALTLLLLLHILGISPLPASAPILQH